MGRALWMCGLGWAAHGHCPRLGSGGHTAQPRERRPSAVRTRSTVAHSLQKEGLLGLVRNAPRYPPQPCGPRQAWAQAWDLGLLLPLRLSFPGVRSQVLEGPAKRLRVLPGRGDVQRGPGSLSRPRLCLSRCRWGCSGEGSHPEGVPGLPAWSAGGISPHRPRCLGGTCDFLFSLLVAGPRRGV